MIARAAGGALESVVDGTTGKLYDLDSADDVEQLAKSLREFDARAFDARMIREHTITFSAERFRQRFTATLDRLLDGSAA